MQISNISSNLINITSSKHQISLKPGTTIKAEIISVEGDTITLKTSNGNILTASNNSNLSLSPKDTLSLLITGDENNLGTITTVMTALNNQPINQSTVTYPELHLIDLGILPSKHNIALYDILLENNLPLTKDLIFSLDKIIKSLPDITNKEAAFFADNNIEPTMENLQVLRNIGNLHIQLDDCFNDVFTQLSSSFGEKEIAFLQNLVSSLTIENNVPILKSNDAINNTIQTENLITDSNIYNSENLINNENIDQVKNSLVDFIYEKNDFPKNQLTNNVIISTVEKFLHTIKNENITMESIIKNEIDIPKDIKQIVSSLPNPTQMNTVIEQVKTDTKQFMSMLLLSFAQKNMISKVSDENMSKSLKTTLSNLPKDLASLVLSKQSSENINKCVTTLKLSDSTMCFVQIPLKLNDYKTTGELYLVTKNKNAKLSLEKGIKIVFALNTQNLGRVESIISANTKDLYLDIKVDNPDTKLLIEKNLNHLSSLLKQTQFNIKTLKISSIISPVNVFNAHTLFGYKQLDISI